MSAWIASDMHIASVVCKAIDDPTLQQKIANMLKKANIRSVNYRYNERTKVTPCDLSKAIDLDWKDTAMLATSLDYQSCERPEWFRTEACRQLLMIRAQAAYKLAEGGRWSI